MRGTLPAAHFAGVFCRLASGGTSDISIRRLPLHIRDSQALQYRTSLPVFIPISPLSFSSLWSQGAFRPGRAKTDPPHRSDRQYDLRHSVWPLHFLPVGHDGALHQRAVQHHCGHGAVVSHLHTVTRGYTRHRHTFMYDNVTHIHVRVSTHERTYVRRICASNDVSGRERKGLERKRKNNKDRKKRDLFSFIHIHSHALMGWCNQNCGGAV